MSNTGKQRRPWNQCKWSLAIAWLCGGGLVFALLVLFSMTNKFGTNTQDAWGWVLTAVMPNLSLIVGVLVSDMSVAAPKKIKWVDTAHYRFSLGLSLVYLLAVLLTLLATSMPFVPDSHRGINMLRLSNLWLGPLQGLVSAALGVFYVRAQPTEDKGRGDEGKEE